VGEFINKSVVKVIAMCCSLGKMKKEIFNFPDGNPPKRNGGGRAR